MKKEVRDCFVFAAKDVKKGKKHKGLIIVKSDNKTARYSSSITSKEVETKYKYMEDLCKKAISQAEEMVFSDKEFKAPKNLYE